MSERKFEWWNPSGDEKRLVLRELADAKEEARKDGNHCRAACLETARMLLSQPPPEPPKPPSVSRETVEKLLRLGYEVYEYGHGNLTLNEASAILAAEGITIREEEK